MSSHTFFNVSMTVEKTDDEKFKNLQNPDFPLPTRKFIIMQNKSGNGKFKNLQNPDFTLPTRKFNIMQNKSGNVNVNKSKLPSLISKIYLFLNNRLVNSTNS